ncbi:hypothetical protein ACTA71_009688 [Dictyostelium dimigraforme]
MDLLETISSEIHYPTNPGPYHELVEDAKGIRIDFIEEIQTGIGISLDKKKGNNYFSANCGILPAFYRLEYGRKIGKNQKISAIVQPDKLQLDLNVLPSKILFGGLFNEKSRFSSEFHISLPTSPSSTTPSSLSKSSNINFSKLFKTISTVGLIRCETNKTLTEFKLSKMNMGDIDHRMAGFSFCYGYRKSLALGLELYCKFLPGGGVTFGGASFGSRYRGKAMGIQYDLTSTYNVFGDLQLTSSVGIIPERLSFSTRFNLNTSNIISAIQFGTRFVGNPIISGHEIPFCLKLRTDTNYENAIALDVDTPLANISIGCFGNKFNLFKNYGINFSF